MGNVADVAVVGGGIVGLAFAWTAARAGQSVVLLERDPVAVGASIRNFGMIWPVGQPDGEPHRRALRSRELWDEAARGAGIALDPCGSLHLAHDRDELDVLGEFVSRARSQGLDRRLVSPAETVALSPWARRAGLLGALFSTTEACVDPRQAIATLPGWLRDTHGVTLRFGKAVTEVSASRVRTSDGELWDVGRVVVCGGSDLRSLFPDVLASAGLKVCKLQMMRTAPQPSGARLGPMLAGGLTLCHYAAFRDCPSLPRLQARFAATLPDYPRFGIHVMASQNAAGEVVIGDSHEYDSDIEPFDKPEIDALILDHLATMVTLPDPRVVARWHGIYAKLADQPFFHAEPLPGAHVVTGLGGAGMTLSFGLAEELWTHWTS